MTQSSAITSTCHSCSTYNSAPPLAIATAIYSTVATVMPSLMPPLLWATSSAAFVVLFIFMVLSLLLTWLFLTLLLFPPLLPPPLLLAPCSPLPLNSAPVVRACPLFPLSVSFSNYASRLAPRTTLSRSTLVKLLCAVSFRFLMKNSEDREQAMRRSISVSGHQPWLL